MSGKKIAIAGSENTHYAVGIVTAIFVESGCWLTEAII
jgi:hypothetical protein